MKKIELLAPAGDFESLISAIQNGANAVYFGANKFNARANSKNFNTEELRSAIEYAKLRNVKTHLTLNILIKNNELEDAIRLVEDAYNAGLDAVIVQDLGLAKEIINKFPNLEVHASTQLTVYDYDGVKKLEEIGFKRIVLARELSINEIKEICEKAKAEIEIFIHGALCISYSGQCLMSSIIGGRSGNRGKCAGTCRLPYELIDKKEDCILEKGYLLSSKDVCTLDILPEIINSGVSSLKIEGRMKSPEYVGIVTSIYRKYIDLIENNQKFVVEEEDKKKLKQIFNRGGFSTGYLKGKLGKNMMYTRKPNHIGIYLGDVISYNLKKGYVKLKLKENIELGDSIAIGEVSCKISELMEENKNIKLAEVNKVVTIGRIKGNIKIGDKIYKTVSNRLIKDVQRINTKENIKRRVDCIIRLNEKEKMEIKLLDIKSNITVKVIGDEISKYRGINEKEAVEEGYKSEKYENRIKEQIKKTGNTVFEIQNIEVQKDNNIFIPIKEINEIRRRALLLLEEKIKEKIKRNIKIDIEKEECFNRKLDRKCGPINISVLLNNINEDFDYLNLKDVNRIYIPISEFLNTKVEKKIKELVKEKNLYVYFPVVLKEKYKKYIENKIGDIVGIGIKGFVISNISQLEMVKKFKLEIIANYTFNIFNNKTISQLEDMSFTTYTVSPEMDLVNIRNLNNENIEKEVIVYGRTVLMNSEYCPIGKYNKCNGSCLGKNIVLKDRKGFEFPVVTDKINCNSKIYNSKITSIQWKELYPDSIRIDILEESIEEINKIIKTYKQNKKLEGKEYTNGNLNIIV